MYNFTLIPVQNVSFYNLLWNTFSYVSLFNSSVGYNTSLRVHSTGSTNKTYKFYQNEYSSSCPSNKLIIDCKCSCNSNIIGVDVDLTDYSCSCITKYHLECEIRIKCLEPSSSFTTSISTKKKYYPYFYSEILTCSNKYNQLMTSCIYFLHTGNTSRVDNSTNSTNYYVYEQNDISNSGQGILTSQYSTKALNSTYNLTTYWQECTIPAEIQGSTKNLIDNNDFNYGRIIYNCISISCEPLPVMKCTLITYLNRAFNLDIIWGTLAFFSAPSPFFIRRQGFRMYH